MSSLTLSMAARSVTAVLAGYATILVGALAFQDVLFGGLSYRSPTFDLLVGGGLTAVAAGVGGYLLAAIAPGRPMLHAVPLVVWLRIETTLLYLQGGSQLWFDALAGGSLVAGVLIGVFAWTSLTGSAMLRSDSRR